MAVRSRRRRIIVFACLGIATVVLVVITLSLAHGASAPCHGLDCPSGGGSSASSSGTDAWLPITAVASIIAALGTLLQGVAAFRKAPADQAAAVAVPAANANVKGEAG
jgi:hypothetical protein